MQRRLHRSVSETRRSVAVAAVPVDQPAGARRRVGTAEHRVRERARRGHAPNVVLDARRALRGRTPGRGKSGAPGRARCYRRRVTREPGGAPPHSPVARKRENSRVAPHRRPSLSAPTPACSPSRAAGRSPSPAGSPGSPRRCSGLGAVLLVEGETGSYGLAGAVSGMLALAYGIAGPQWGRAMDRRGQGRVLRVAMVGFAVTGIGVRRRRRRRRARLDLVPAGRARRRQRPQHRLADPRPVVGGPRARRAADGLRLRGRGRRGDLRRSGRRWSRCWPPWSRRRSASSPGSSSGTIGGLWLAAQRDTEPPPQPVDGGRPAARRAALLTPSLLVVVVAYVAVGALFGSHRRRGGRVRRGGGRPALSGAALAVFALGSLVAGLAYGLARLPGTLAARFVGTRGRLRPGRAAAVGRGSLPVLIALRRSSAGLTIAPVLVSGTSLVESRVTARRADRVAGLDDHRAHHRGHRRLGARRCRRGRLGRAATPSPSRRWPPPWRRSSRWPGRRRCAGRPGCAHARHRRCRLSDGVAG